MIKDLLTNEILLFLISYISAGFIYFKMKKGPYDTGQLYKVDKYSIVPCLITTVLFGYYLLQNTKVIMLGLIMYPYLLLATLGCFQYAITYGAGHYDIENDRARHILNIFLTIFIIYTAQSTKLFMNYMYPLIIVAIVSNLPILKYFIGGANSFKFMLMFAYLLVVQDGVPDYNGVALVLLNYVDIITIALISYLPMKFIMDCVFKFAHRNCESHHLAIDLPIPLFVLWACMLTPLMA